ncbi:MAG: peptide-methionine (R)-S-oxide reductase MsrB [Thermoplasmatota archaeon]
MTGTELKLSEEEWKARLSPDRFNVLRKKGTERPFTGELLHNKERGTYHCAGCGLELFRSDSKFNSGSGWPSFSDVVDNDNIKTETDVSFGMARTEIMCARCGGHLGHVFDDGPPPTGLRYCVNSLSLDFSSES